MYKIYAILFGKNKKIKNHIPYFLGFVIEGPKGGKYLADVFNSERIIEKHYGRILSERIDTFANELGKKTNNILMIDVSNMNDFVNNNRTKNPDRMRLKYVEKELNFNMQVLYRNSADIKVIENIVKNLELPYLGY